MRRAGRSRDGYGTWGTFNELFKHAMITIVSGLPRSGTSMMMQMLDEGGMVAVTDNVRKADIDNLQGYYEVERVKQIKADSSWLSELEGKSVKMISHLLFDLPTKFEFSIIFMRRRMSEVLASQAAMLTRRNKPSAVDDQEMAQLLSRHLTQVGDWLKAQPNIRILYVDFNRLIADPTPQVDAVRDFLQQPLDQGKMVQVVDPRLYRQRRN